MININDVILIKTVSNLSFTGTLLDNNYDYMNKKNILLKPSDDSGIIMIIPKDEISKVFTMDGGVLESV